MDNQKQGIPKYEGESGRLFSRAHFLDGTLKTYYGPGQPPDAGEPGNYENPTSWRPAGSVLSPPQVVWLYLSRPTSSFAVHVIQPVFFGITHAETLNLFQVSSGMYYADGTVVLGYSAASSHLSALGIPDDWSFSLGAWVDLPHEDSGNSAFYYLSGTGTIDQYWPDIGFGLGTGQHYVAEPAGGYPYVEEYDRLKAIYEDVIAKLESLRPGRTFAQLVEPWAYVQVHDPTSGLDGWGWSANYFHDEPGEYWPYMNPADQSTYYGTDFLLVLCGCPDTTEENVQDATDESTQADIVAAQAVSLATLAGTKAKMRRWAARYYAMAMDIGDIAHYDPPAYSDPPQFTIDAPTFVQDENPDVPVNTIVYKDQASSEAGDNTDYNSVGYWDANEGDDGPSSWEAIKEGVNAYVDSINAINQVSGVGNVTQLQSDANALTALGFDAKYMGVTSGIGSSADLLAVIAQHYGFDPGTGKDI
jgi:hypothetical protein